MKRIAAIIFILLTTAACAEPTCYELTEEYRESVDAIVDEWDDALQIANSTARMSLAGPLGELQEINRSTKQVDVPECASLSHGSLLSYQEKTIEGFLSFMAQAEDSTVNAQFDVAAAHLRRWANSYAELNEEPE